MAATESSINILALGSQYKFRHIEAGRLDEFYDYRDCIEDECNRYFDFFEPKMYSAVFYGGRNILYMKVKIHEKNNDYMHCKV